MREAMEQANRLAICAQLISLLLIASVVHYLFYLLSAFLLGLSVFESFWSFVAQTSVVLNVLMMPVLMFVGIVVLHGLARLLGGEGVFPTMFYTNLLFQVPLLLLIVLVSSIPLEGTTWFITARNLVLIAIQLYVAVLQTFALRAVYGLSQGRAVICVLVLAVLSLPLAFFLSIFIL